MRLFQKQALQILAKALNVIDIEIASTKKRRFFFQVRLPSIPMEQENPFLRAEMRGDDEVYST